MLCYRKRLKLVVVLRRDKFCVLFHDPLSKLGADELRNVTKRGSESLT
jgi:hypothetical protein